MKALSLRAGLGETAVRDILKREMDPKRETMVRIAEAMGMTTKELFEGDAPLFQFVPVIGAITEGDAWEAIEGEPESVQLRVEDGEPVALEVRGDSMAPYYRNGDLLIGARRAGSSADNLIGLDCIIETDAGERLVKILTRGTARGRFTLRSYNPTKADIVNARIVWAAPVEWVRRRHGKT